MFRKLGRFRPFRFFKFFIFFIVFIPLMGGLTTSIFLDSNGQITMANINSGTENDSFSEVSTFSDENNGLGSSPITLRSNIPSEMGGSHNLDVHVIEDSTKEDYAYGWAKLANYYWNETSFGQLDSSGKIRFTEIPDGEFYLEIYPQGDSSVYGKRIYCTNVTVVGDTSIDIPVYDYRGHVALQWGLKEGETNMTKYILDRVDLIGLEPGDIIQLYFGHANPTDPATDWGKPTYADVVKTFKNEGFRVWINPRLTYAENYDFWRYLDRFSETGYSDGDFYDEGSWTDDIRSHCQFAQHYAMKTEVYQGSQTSDLTTDLGESACIHTRQQDYWTVFDCTDGEYLSYGTGTEKWTFNNNTQELTIHSATRNHQYQIYWLSVNERTMEPWGYSPFSGWGRDRLVEHLQWWFENCTLSDGECALDGVHPNYWEIMRIGYWDDWESAWAGMCHPTVIDWFLGNYSKYSTDFKLSWVCANGADEFKGSHNEEIPFMHDWLNFRQELLYDFLEPQFNLIKRYNASIAMYDGDNNALFSAEKVINMGVDILEHQCGTDFDRNSYFNDYSNYWASRILYMNDWEETWQGSNDLKGFRSQLQRSLAEGALPDIMYNHQSPYGYDMPLDHTDEYKEVHNFFKELWKTYRQYPEWKVGKVYLVFATCARSNYYYGYSDDSKLTPKRGATDYFLFHLPVQLAQINIYDLEANGVPDDCDLLILASGESESYDYNTYNTLYSDTLNSTLTYYTENGGSVLFMGLVGTYATNGTELTDTGWQKLLSMTYANYPIVPERDLFYVDESHWITQIAPDRGICDGMEGFDPNYGGKVYGEPMFQLTHKDKIAFADFNITADADESDVLIWYGDSNHKYPFLYLREIGSGNVAYTPYETATIWMGGRTYETLYRTALYLMNKQSYIKHVEVELDELVENMAVDKLMFYNIYNNNDSWLISIRYDSYATGQPEWRELQQFKAELDFSDFMDSGKSYLIYVYDRTTTSDAEQYHNWDTQKGYNTTLLLSPDGDVYWSKGDLLSYTFEREITHMFLIKEAKTVEGSLIQVKSLNYVNITQENYASDILTIDAEALSGTNAEFIVHTTQQVNSVQVEGINVPFQQVLGILSFNATFASPITIAVFYGPDTIDPTVSIVSPENNGWVGYDYMLSADVFDNVGIDNVEWFYSDNGVDWISITNDTNGQYRWDTSLLDESTYYLNVEVNDTSGNTVSSDTITFNVDHTYPTCSIFSSGDGEPISGMERFYITAYDTNLAHVYFIIDSSIVIEITHNFESGQYYYDLDTTILSDGSHVFRGMAVDSAGNNGVSSSITSTVDNYAEIFDGNDEGGGGGTSSSEEDNELKVDVYLSDTSVYQGEIIYVQINVTDVTSNLLLYDAIVKIEFQGEIIYAYYLSESGLYTCEIKTLDFSPGLHETKIIVEKDGYPSVEETRTIHITDWILPRFFNSKAVESYLSEFFLPMRVGMISILLAIFILILRDKVLIERRKR